MLPKSEHEFCQSLSVALRSKVNTEEGPLQNGIPQIRKSIISSEPIFKSSKGETYASKQYRAPTKSRQTAQLMFAPATLDLDQFMQILMAQLTHQNHRNR
jgi:hypothetical protein